MKIFCVGRNYAAHARELKNEVPDEPVIFMKPPTALPQKGNPLFYPDWTQDLHYEGELVLKISRQGKHIQERFARKYYREVSIGIDFTARDVQQRLKEKGLPWELAKGFDGSAAIGEFIPLEEAMQDGHILFSLQKNGEIVQQGTTQDLLFSFDALISFLSRHFTLQQGDLIFTGTPQGVGPCSAGDIFTGSIGNKELLRAEVR